MGTPPWVFNNGQIEVYLVINYAPETTEPMIFASFLCFPVKSKKNPICTSQNSDPGCSSFLRRPRSEIEKLWPIELKICTPSMDDLRKTYHTSESRNQPFSVCYGGLKSRFSA